MTQEAADSGKYVNFAAVSDSKARRKVYLTRYYSLSLRTSPWSTQSSSFQQVSPFQSCANKANRLLTDSAKQLATLKANLKAETKAAVDAGAFVNLNSAKYVHDYVVSLVVDKQRAHALALLNFAN